jgi:hypothetical protein
MCHIDV